jgi:hypothetical protein
VEYNEITQVIARQEGNSEVQNARLFALVNVAMADAGITAWDTKYVYNFWRPVAAVRESDPGTGPTGLGDGNPNTHGDVNWTPLGAPCDNGCTMGSNFTPPFPAYTSGHATFGAATFRVLADFYGRDDIAFSWTSDEFNGKTRDQFGNVRPIVTRSYTSFSQAAFENAQSRIYLGIHWTFDRDQGLLQGKEVGDYIFQHILLPLDTSTRAAASMADSNHDTHPPSFADLIATLTISTGAPTWSTPAPVATSLDRLTQAHQETFFAVGTDVHVLERSNVLVDAQQLPEDTALDLPLSDTALELLYSPG